MLSARKSAAPKMVTWPNVLYAPKSAWSPAATHSTKDAGSSLYFLSSYCFSSAAAAEGTAAAAIVTNDGQAPRPQPLKDISYGAVFSPSRPEFSMVQCNMAGHTKGGSKATALSLQSIWPRYTSCQRPTESAATTLSSAAVAPALPASSVPAGTTRDAAAMTDVQAPTTCTTHVQPMQEDFPDAALERVVPGRIAAGYIVSSHAVDGAQFWPPPSAANGWSVAGAAAARKQRIPTGAGNRLNRQGELPSTKLLSDLHGPVQGLSHTADIADNSATGAGTTKIVGDDDDAASVVVAAAAHYHRCQRSVLQDDDTVCGSVLINNFAEATYTLVVTDAANIIPIDFVSSTIKAPAVTTTQAKSHWAIQLYATPTVPQWTRPLPRPCWRGHRVHESSRSRYGSGASRPTYQLSVTADALVVLPLLLLLLLLLVQQMSDHRHLLNPQLKSTQTLFD